MIIHIADEEAYFDNFPADYLSALTEQGRENDSPTSVYTMGDPNDPETPAFVIFKMAPNSKLPRHSHPCQRFEVVIQGSMESEGETLVTGDIMMAAPNEPYGPHYAGPEGCTVVEYFGRVFGAYNIDWRKRNGDILHENQVETWEKIKAEREQAALSGGTQ